MVHYFYHLNYPHVTREEINDVARRISENPVGFETRGSVELSPTSDKVLWYENGTEEVAFLSPGDVGQSKEERLEFETKSEEVAENGWGGRRMKKESIQMEGEEGAPRDVVANTEAIGEAIELKTPLLAETHIITTKKEKKVKKVKKVKTSKMGKVSDASVKVLEEPALEFAVEKPPFDSEPAAEREPEEVVDPWSFWGSKKRKPSIRGGFEPEPEPEPPQPKKELEEMEDAWSAASKKTTKEKKASIWGLEPEFEPAPAPPPPPEPEPEPELAREEEPPQVEEWDWLTTTSKKKKKEKKEKKKKKEKIWDTEPELQPAPEPEPELEKEAEAAPAEVVQVVEDLLATTSCPEKKKSSPIWDIPKPGPVAEEILETNLLVHANVYNLAVKYSVPGLKVLAGTKFEEAAPRAVESSEFLEVAEKVYTMSLDGDRKLRDEIVRTILAKPAVMGKKDMQDVLRRTGELSLDILLKDKGFSREV